MKILFNRADKSITFLDGTETINANDVMYQYLEVEVVPALGISESLWVVFKNEEYGEYSNEILIADNGAEAKAEIPEEVLVAGDWKLQLLVRKYLTSDPTRYIQEGSEVVPFTVSDGLRTTAGANVNNATVAALYQEAQEVLTTRETLQESIDANTAAIAPLVPEMENVKKLVSDQENQLADHGGRIFTLETQAAQTNAAVAQNTSDIEGLRLDMQNESHFRGWVTTNAEVEALSGNANDYAYSAESGTVWVFENGAWTDSGKPVPDKATPLGDSTPLVNGEASPGESENAAREDHRHPTDETRASAEALKEISEKVDELSAGGETESPTVLTVDLSNIDTLTVAFAAQQPNATKIDWGDGAVTTDFTELPSHTYAEVGTYEIRIYGATELVGPGLQPLIAMDCCQSLIKAVIGESVTKIGMYAFYNCRFLKYVTIPDSVTSIGSAAFYECPNLAKVVVGSGITEIAENAFYYMPAILQLNAKTPPTISSYTFGTSSSEAIILVPRESVEAYRSAENWTSLAAQITANAWLSDLDDYVKFTDYATTKKAGVILLSGSYGFGLTNAGTPYITKIFGNYDSFNSAGESVFIGAGSLKNIQGGYVKEGIVNNTETLTDENQTSACEWLGALKKQEPSTPNTNWAYTTRVAADGTVVQVLRELSASVKADVIPITGTGGTLRVGNPTADAHATTKAYVDNLPDYITLSDEQKAKWRAMLGIE